MPTTSNPRFILWDPSDGPIRRDADDPDSIISDGILGRVGIDNVYLTIYAGYPVDNDTRPRDLAIGECIKGVGYTLSGSSGIYDIYRVA